MAQKDKVKELVGRGLNSYHTKTLQQIDRIEKKNKEQNHKISILTNELDNDYLTKTEEGSVVSLEHSKEGMVYLDELQGNTLVNYCTDGSKELTLNGDIDVEGTFVTTTEGVDNGKVDVMCEGNTLVNLVPSIKNGWYASGSGIDSTLTVKTDTSIKLSKTKNGSAIIACDDSLKLTTTNKTYTITFDLLRTFSNDAFATSIRYNDGTYYKIGSLQTIGKNKISFTHKADKDITNSRLVFGYTGSTEDIGEIEIKNIVLLEGDWTNKEIPPYFEGIKSVGQDDENGHKIEILSRKSRENLLIGGGFEVHATKDSYADNKTNPIKIDPNLDLQSLINKTLLLSVYKHTEGEGQVNPTMDEVLGKRFGIHGAIRWGKSGDVNVTALTYPLVLVDNDWGYINTIQYKVEKITPPVGYDIIKSFNISFQPCSKPSENNDATWILKNAKLEIVESTTDTPSEWCPHLSEDTTYQYHNKKEILLYEPLRNVPNGTKDQIIKIGSKYFIERNCGCVTLDENITWNEKEILDGVNRYRYVLPNANSIHIQKNAISDKYITTIGDENYEHLRVSNGWVWYYNTQDLTYDEVKNIFTNKPTKLVYQLATPIYEPLEIEPTLNTYNDVTHISNNSIIPCNMKVKNSGYNAIIKPYTLYTVALDTNKSGTIGMNLGGVKGTTTNNVLTLTTPATLTDDSLRLHGKGIKGSKVRLLEGDKTNWIPSHFEGMKSSFEDKLQDDGTYKMEILSNNKNLFNGTWIYDEKNNKINSSDLIKVKPNTTYTISDNLNYRYQIYEYSDKSTHFNSMYPYAGSYTFTTNKRTHYLRFSTYAPSTDVDVKFILEEGRNITLYEPNKSNKIQFSSIEPLRGVDDVKDRFVFKDGKLMIERNCKELRLTTENLKLQGQHGANTRFYYDVRLLGFDIEQKPLCVENLKQVDFYDKSYTSKSSYLPCYGYDIDWGGWQVGIYMPNNEIKTLEDANAWLNENIVNSTWKLSEPTYEEIPFELQKIILEGYENGTLFFDTNIPPTSTTTYAGETPIVKSVKLNKTEVLSNTNDINDNIVPYLMDMDYRVVCLQLQSENINDGVSMLRLFGGTYEMLQRDILSKRYSIDEYRYRLDAYLSANKITNEEYEELGEMLNE